MPLTKNEVLNELEIIDEARQRLSAMLYELYVEPDLEFDSDVVDQLHDSAALFVSIDIAVRRLRLQGKQGLKELQSKSHRFLVETKKNCDEYFATLN